MTSMKQLFSLFSLLFVLLFQISCTGNKRGVSQQTDSISTDTFALGADLGWITEMESQGDKFYNRQGEERECTALMKELGLDAVRLRVWVDPQAHDNWCNAADMLVKARRAHALGMDIMVDFHYSDWWADPGQQHKPAAWRGLDFEGLKQALAQHTTEVLQALKAEGITPRWVQVGNEIRPGMLWDERKELSAASWDIKEKDLKDAPATATDRLVYPANWDNLAALIDAGYGAVKQVFEEAIVIVHLDNGYDEKLYNWFFDELKKRNARWDMIGMSLYPYWTRQAIPDATPDKVIDACIKNINQLSAKYACDVMLVEIGMECADDEGKLAADSVLQEGKRQLSRVIRECRTLTNGRCKGVFYWEPECNPSKYRLGAFTEEGKPTVIMDAFSE